jgi:high-affinity nickel-transport protein
VNSTILIALALGLRHGTDPDHLTAIDGLSRIRPRVTNGLFFALGHGVVVTLLAVGVGAVISNRVAFLGPWVLILIGVLNLWRVFRPSHSHPTNHRPLVAQPFLLGMLLAAGFETASQFAALILTNQLSPWLVGAAFTLGMVIVDGLDGYLAASTQYLATAGNSSAASASRLLGILVVAFAFALGGAELAGIDLDRIALPTGLLLFATVITIRVWARKEHHAHARTVDCPEQSLVVPVAA